MSSSISEGGPTQAVIRDGSQLRLRSRKLRIECVSGPDAGQIFDVPGPEARIGTSRGCDVVLQDPTVSRHHLTLRVEGGGLRILDSASTNGTWVDGLQVRDAYARPDSTIVIGKTSLRLRLLTDTVELPLSSRESFGGLLGRSPAMRLVFAMLERVAPTDTTVLIEGETGTGKELVAEALHEESPRASGPFVVFDCSAVSASLVESELFGHVKGAFTGAVSDRTGAFEAASGGTIFLDEIGELPLELQPKLLRALERLEIRRVGSNSPRRVDVRIVAATNRSLAAEVERGTFREDLYHRLAVVTVRLPPLRERAEDIPILVEHFARSLARRGQPAATISERAMQRFMDRAWPGNVRELRNAVARTMSLGEHEWPPAGEQNAPPRGSFSIDLGVPLVQAREALMDAFERAYLVEALQKSGGNVTRAAEIAGVNRKFIQRAVKRLGLREKPEGEQ